MSTKSKPFYEEVLETFNGTVIRSNVRPAKQFEIKEARRLHKLGKCPHTIVFDEYSWMYDFRSCYICGKGLGTV